MNENSITNITHFLDDKGALPSSLLAPARKTAQGLGLLIASVTGEPRTSFKTGVLCWGKYHQKPCTGEIEAGLGSDSFDILWHCPQCNDSGSISHWENTFWDCDFAYSGGRQTAHSVLATSESQF